MSEITVTISVDQLNEHANAVRRAVSKLKNYGDQSIPAGLAATAEFLLGLASREAEAVGLTAIFTRAAKFEEPQDEILPPDLPADISISEGEPGLGATAVAGDAVALEDAVASELPEPEPAVAPI